LPCVVCGSAPVAGVLGPGKVCRLGTPPRPEGRRLELAGARASPLQHPSPGPQPLPHPCTWRPPLPTGPRRAPTARSFLAAGGFYAVKRYREKFERRMTGMKKEGDISVVVTDIEGYSGGRFWVCAARLTEGRGRTAFGGWGRAAWVAAAMRPAADDQLQRHRNLSPRPPPPAPWLQTPSPTSISPALKPPSCRQR
jgi:hypothetical protein